jgi:diguanylate cyclase (GGDEF)-like protein/PAS domain S-box-containing protein
MSDDARPQAADNRRDRDRGGARPPTADEVRVLPLFDACPDAIVVIDAQGVILLANTSVEAVFGYSASEVIGLSVAVLQPERLREAHETSLKRYLTTGERTLDWRATGTFGLHRDGHEFPIEVAFTELGQGRFGGFIRDVSARVAVERALKASEAQYRDLLDNAYDIIFTYGLDGTFQYVNEAGLRTYGYTFDEILRLNVRDIADPGHLAQAYARVTEGARESGSLAPYQMLTRTRTGEHIWIEVSNRIVRDQDGAPVAVQGIARDVTARREAEEALARTREFRDRVMESSPNAIGAVDLEGRITLVNRRFCEMTGYSQEELTGGSFDLVISLEALPSIAAVFERVKAGESVGDLEFDALRKDGSTFMARATLRPLMDHGEIVGVIGITEDITERWRAEQALARSSELRDRVMDATTNAIAAFDLDGRMTLVNQRLCEMTGYSQEELIGRRLGPLIRPGAAPLVPPALARVLAGESIDQLEFAGERKDGTQMTVVATLRPLYDGDRIIGVIGTAEDVTERKWNDSLLRAQQDLLEVVAQGSPLNAVLGTVALTVELLLPGALCSILLLDAESGTLHRGSAPSLPDAYTLEIDGIAIGPNVGSCGSAAFRRETVIVSDIATDPLWADFRDLALSHELRACWSTPIISDAGAVLGAFAIYRREPHTPADFERQLVAVVTHITAIAIERRDADEAMGRRAAELGELNAQLLVAHDALAESKRRLEEKSRLLEVALVSERERARRDPLTGALNHAAIADEVHRLIQDPATGSLALAMIDVDGLKAVNDTWGHQMGDAVLLGVADALRRCGAIVGRYGGDEFVAILPGADRAASAAYRQEVDAALAAIDLRDGGTGSRIQIVASVGLAIYPEEADAVEDLIKLSDSAMYAARRQRADVMASTAFARIHGGDRAAEIVGEIVPFLTSPGELNEKLNLVAARLSAGAGYDGVNFSLYPASGATARTASFAEDSGDAVAQYNAESLPEEEAGPVRTALEATRRPIIIDCISESEFATPAQKEILAQVGIRSALIAPMIWRGNVLGAISVGSKREAAFGPRDAQFLSAIATQVTAIVRTAALVDDLQAASSRLQQAHTGTVMMLAAAAEAHDNTTGRHLHRVRTIAERLAREIGHTDEKAKEIGLAAVLHDIGKIRVPDYVLGSTASLSDAEWALMKDHTIWGGEFLLARGGFELAAQVARSHHERWDGSGYPDGLFEEQIPEPAAITAVADSLDAIISDRPYRAGRPLADAIEEIRAWSGRQFNPHIVDALVRLYERGELPDMEARISEESDDLAA